MLHLRGGTCWAPFSEISGAEREEGAFPASPLGTVLGATPAQALWGGLAAGGQPGGGGGAEGLSLQADPLQPGWAPRKGCSTRLTPFLPSLQPKLQGAPFTPSCPSEA